MGLALAIDYTLLMISRYRDELASGPSHAGDHHHDGHRRPHGAVSAVTVALSMAVMVLFPMNFLRFLRLRGRRHRRLRGAVGRRRHTGGDHAARQPPGRLGRPAGLRRMLGRPEPKPLPVDQQFWYRSAKFVMGRAVPIGLATWPCWHSSEHRSSGVRPGFPDDRVLPKSASAHLVGDLLRSDFAIDSDSEVPIVIPDSGGLDRAEVDRYAAELSAVPEVDSVSSPSGSYVDGRLTGPPLAATGEVQGTLLTVGTSLPLFSREPRTS